MYPKTITQYSNKSLVESIAEIWDYKDLIITLSAKEISIKYKQALAGFFWVVFQPMVTSGIFTVIFGYLAKIPSEEVPYPIFLLTGILFWQFFQKSASQGANSLVANMNIINKVYFPRSILPLISIITNIFDLLIPLSVLVICLPFFGVDLGLSLLAAPVFVLMLSFLSYSIGLLASPLNALYRDVSLIVSYGLQFLMYATPIIYPRKIVPEKYQLLIDLNPVATIIEWIRWSILGTEAPVNFATVSCVIFLIVSFIIGIKVFKDLELNIVDKI